ncbi:hypothetical protein QYF36_002626 [Acer negundo]|nr:hypothetical protein QYF36_002626 [Acer negundo]
MDPFPVPVALDNQPSPPHSPPRPSVAAASPAASAALPTLNNPPPYAEMIYAAITVLKKDGSSKIAIGKHIEQSYSNLPANHSTLLTQHLQRLKNTGYLLMVKKSYKLPRCDAPVPETNNNNQDNAINISSSAHGSKTSRGRGRPPKNLNAAKAQPVSVPVGLVDQTPHLTPAKHVRGRQIGGLPVGLGGRADAAVPKLPKLKRRTKRPRKVQAQGEANVAEPKSEVQAHAQPILTVHRTRKACGEVQEGTKRKHSGHVPSASFVTT